MDGRPEDHANWPVLCVLLRQWGHKPSTEWTKFSQEEIDSARWLHLCAWESGYPQPESTPEYMQVTYNLTGVCEGCWAGVNQKAPFRLKREPKWGRRGIMQLHWVVEEIFVTPQVWETILKPHGIECRPVANVRGVELNTVVQLVITEEVGVVTDGLTSEPCETCKRPRYNWPTRGFFPPLTEEPKQAIARTKQYFGSGGATDRAILISQNIARALQAHKVRGAQLTPVASVLPALVA